MPRSPHSRSHEGQGVLTPEEQRLEASQHRSTHWKQRGIWRECCVANSREDAGQAQRWGLILAGGDGARLLPLTRLISGDDRPKQFCPLMGGETLLAQTQHRVGLTIPSDQTFVVVTRTHEPFYAPLLAMCLRNTWWSSHTIRGRLRPSFIVCYD